MRHRQRHPLLGEHTLEVEVEVEACGLSRLHICTAIPRLGLRTCTMLCAAMITPKRLQLRHTSRIAVSEPAWLPGLPARWLSRIVARLLSGPTLRAGHEFLAADFPIWDTKCYQSPPRLAQGDGPIGPYRLWARRFYSSSEAGPSTPHIGPARNGSSDASEGDDRVETTSIADHPLGGTDRRPHSPKQGGLGRIRLALGRTTAPGPNRRTVVTRKD